MTRTPALPITRHLEIEALQEAVRWPNPEPQTIITLVGQLLAARRDEDGYHYFRELAATRPEQPLFLALEGLFQARLAGQKSLLTRPSWVNDAVGKLDRAVAAAPGITTYFRGLVLADLPAILGRAQAAIADLEWVLANRERFPIGLRRNVYRALAKAHGTLGRKQAAAEALQRSGYPSLDPELPSFTTDYWLTARDGFHFTSPRLVELAPRILVAQGYDFADVAFILTDDSIVAIDAGTTTANVQAMLRDLRRLTDLPIRTVILTHAHWDHVGGLGALLEPGVEVIAQAGFAGELRLVNQTGVPFRYFFGPHAKQQFDVAPNHLIHQAEMLTVGGTELRLYPVTGGETADALLIHLPAIGVIFTGDILMPYLGAPFLAEGSVEGLFETLDLIQSLTPRQLIHGHPPLTETFTVEALPGLAAALRDLYQQVLQAIRDSRTLSETLHQNHLPDVLRTQPAAVVRYLVMRDNAIKRLYHQRTGYWKPDGEGLEQFAPQEWAAALNLLGGESERSFARTAETLLGQGDHALALKLADLGLLAHPESTSLTEIRRRALNRLRERHQQLNPFKFIVYSEWAGAELPPIAEGELAVRTTTSG